MTSHPLTARMLAAGAPTDTRVPTYDRAALTVGIVHVGVGGFHRAHQAMYLDALMNKGLAHDWGICGVGLLPGDRAIRDAMHAQDCLYTLVEKGPGSAPTARVVGSIVDYLFAPDDPERVVRMLVRPAVRIVSLTVTEAGYNMHRVTGEFDPQGPGIAADLSRPSHPATVFGLVVEALRLRREAGVPPFTVVSCDNIQGNGDVARRAFSSFAELRDPDLGAFVRTEVSFPNSMVDRITPTTTDEDRKAVETQYGIIDRSPVVCEPFTQWVLQDAFPQGRPPLEQAGVQLTDDVVPYELAKLRLLNAGHQALGYAGLLAGYHYVHDAAADPVFASFLRAYMLREAAASLRPAAGLDVDTYVSQVVERFGNPAIGDTLARLCVDGSERMPKFVLPVVRHQLAHGGDIDRAVMIIACWARWAEGVSEQGEALALVDPAAEELAARARTRDDDLAFVRNRDVFGDLAEDTRFSTTFRQALRSVRERGARESLAALAGR